VASWLKSHSVDQQNGHTPATFSGLIAIMFYLQGAIRRAFDERRMDLEKT
jgi:hypothetical protein